MSDDDFVVNRWRRYGKDRLYVISADGTKIGFWDLVAGEGHPESPEDLPALVAAVEGWQAARDVDRVRVSHSVAAAAPTASGPSSGVPKHFSTGPQIGEPSASAESAPTTGEPALTGTPATQPWIDLTTNRAGAEAREQALLARNAAPMKSTLARVLGVHTDERAWRIGANGEEKVAAQLAKAAKNDPRWQFLHAIPVGDRGSDIDHLVVGPGGVFTVNTKHHPKAKIWVGGDTFLVNGSKQPYIRNSRYEAARASKLLTAACGFPVHVEGLVVTVNAADVVIKSQPKGVNVTWRNNLATWLLRHGEIHPSETVSAIYDAARRSTTWRA